MCFPSELVKASPNFRSFFFFFFVRTRTNLYSGLEEI